MDFNGDRRVDFKDFSMLAQYWRHGGSSADTAPLPSGDGIVNGLDLAAFADRWLVGCERPVRSRPTRDLNPADNAIHVGTNADSSGGR